MDKVFFVVDVAITCMWIVLGLFELIYNPRPRPITFICLLLCYVLNQIRICRKERGTWTTIESK